MHTPIFCTRCEAKLNRKSAVMLEFDQRTLTFTNKYIPQEFSQGGFWFGKDCAKVELRKDFKERVALLRRIPEIVKALKQAGAA